ncbi:MAG: AI-2E family transporter, partial [Planctomycetota bacterium]
RKKVPEAIGIPVVLGVVLLVGIVVLASLTNSMQSMMGDIPAYSARIQELGTTLIDKITDRTGIDHSKELDENIFSGLDVSRVLGFMTTALGQFSALLGNLFLIILLVIFILFEFLDLPGKVAAIRGNDKDHGEFERIVKSVNRYIAIKSIVSLGTGTFAGVACALLGVPYAFLWGATAFLLNFIPNIGSILAAVPPILLALIEPELGLGEAATLTMVYVGINVVFGNLIEPRMMGKSLDLSTLVVFVSMVFWGWVFGAVGMFLSVPLTMVIKIAMEGSETTRPIAILLGSGQPAQS